MVLHSFGRGRPLNAPVSFGIIVAILLIAAVPVCAQAQNPKVREDDAKKVVTIISGDKVKTKTYCDILKLIQQVEQASEKNDRKMVDELSEKIATLKKEALGPEYHRRPRERWPEREKANSSLASHTRDDKVCGCDRCH